VLLVRAYRRPRELTWVSGILLLFLTLALGFSGYLLPWNELSYHATLVGTTIPGVVPGIGGFVTHVLRGGEQVSGDTITRFYAAHVALLPLAFGGVLAIHLLLVQLQGMSLPAGLTAQQVKDRRPFFSEFALIDAGLWLVILGVLVTLAIFFPAEVGPQADPLKPAPEGIKPDWYFLFLFQTLKWVPESVGVALIGLGSLLLLLVPWLDCPAGRERRSPWFTAVALGLLAYAAAAQAIAWLAPGVEQAREELGSETYRLDVLVPWLVFFWAVIGFLLFFLRQLLRENTRVRKLRAQLPVSSGPAGPGCCP
jgi:cytochrome b6